MDNVNGALQMWYRLNAFDNGFFGPKPRKKWRWPTMDELCEKTGMDEDGVLADIEQMNDICGEQIVVIRNGKVGFASNPSNKDGRGREIYNPNSGF